MPRTTRWSGRRPYSVQGMTCEGCSALVEKAIKDVPSVLSVKVDFDTRRAVVSSEACCPAPTEPIIQAVKKAGYRATVIESDPNTGPVGKPTTGDEK